VNSNSRLNLEDSTSLVLRISTKPVFNSEFESFGRAWYDYICSTLLSTAKLTPKSDRLHRQFLKALRDLSLRLPTGENDFSYASARFYSLMDIAKVLRVDRRNRLGEGRSDNILID